ncbi:alkanesulfonate-binding protein, partial [Dickeya undicola]
DYIKLMADQSQIPAALFEEQFRPDSLNLQTSPRLDPFLRSNLQDSAQRAQAAGLIRSAFSVEAWLDNRVVDQALTELKL